LDLAVAETNEKFLEDIIYTEKSSWETKCGLTKTFLLFYESPNFGQSVQRMDLYTN
jgi:hypothetical protein